MYLQGQKVWITLLHLWIHKTNNNNNNNKTTKIHETKMQSLEMYMEESCLLVYVLCLSSTVTIATVLDWKWIHFEKSIQVILSQSMGGGGCLHMQDLNNVDAKTGTSAMTLHSVYRSLYWSVVGKSVRVCSKHNNLIPTT